MALNLVVAVLDRGPADLHEMAVLLAIADSADKDTGEAWPSQATMARRARQSDRSVRNIIKRLLDDGWLLSVERQVRPNGSHRSSLYTMNLAKLGEGRAGGSDASDQGGASQHGAASVRKAACPSARNGVPPPPGTGFRPPPERGSTHAPERGSGLDPSHHLEPSRAGAGEGAVDGERVALLAASLTAFQASRVLAGQSVRAGGRLFKPGDPLTDAVRSVLRGPDRATALAELKSLYVPVHMRGRAESA